MGFYSIEEILLGIAISIGIFMIFPIVLRLCYKRPLEPKEAKGKMIAYILVMLIGFNTICILMRWDTGFTGDISVILNTISALLEWDMFIGSLWLVILGIIAYHTILVSGSFVKSFNALASVLHAEILRAEKVIKAAWENHYTGLDKGAARTMKHFEPAEQLHQRYQAWMQEKEDAMDAKALEEGYYLLAGLHQGKDYLEAYYAAKKLIRADVMKQGDWTAVKQVKTSEIYKELLPTEKDVLRRQNMNKNYAAFLQKEVGNIDGKDMRQGSALLWYYTETEYKDVEKAETVAEKMLEAYRLHPTEGEHLKGLRQLSVAKKAFEADMKNPTRLKKKPNINFQSLEKDIVQWEEAAGKGADGQTLKLGGYVLSYAMRFGQPEASYRVASKLLALYENEAAEKAAPQAAAVAYGEAAVSSAGSQRGLQQEAAVDAAEQHIEEEEVFIWAGLAGRTSTEASADNQANLQQGAAPGGAAQQDLTAEEGSVWADLAAQILTEVAADSQTDSRQETVYDGAGQKDMILEEVFIWADSSAQVSDEAVADSQIYSVQEEQVQICHRCGIKLPAGSVFCMKCGTKVI